VSVPGPGANAAWLARSRAAVFHPCTQMKVHETLAIVPVARGEGACCSTSRGAATVDAVSSWWSTRSAHANPRINRRDRRPAPRRSSTCCSPGLHHRPVVELSERLADWRRPGLGHACYGSDGATATEIALKMSFHAWANRAASRKSAAS